MHSSIFVILIEPQMGENIGATARVMSNFGCCNLRIVNPRDGWPNQKALEMAVHGKFVVEQAEIFQDIRSAIADISYLIATTANTRYLAKTVNGPSDSVQKIAQHLDSKHSIGLMFGRERSGLTNEEISFADEIVRIRTSRINPSLNLAQAVCIILYELSKLDQSNTNEFNLTQKATQAEISYLIKHLESELDAANFFQVPEKKEGMMQNIRNIIMRMHPHSQDVRTLRGIIKAIRKNGT
ncbi:MAG: tRNA C32,U32 (ribose-2'-O)-methylase TrmJ or a related methyltransferase [Candidatus Midichloria mitochondrii]|nr:RNA methyltransferase [Candidatus Midichloria mitochondrii]MDJ1256031.1 RNA methyltransferase [Candidatus Midichloria mitochondrii]MDJ1287730.1 RNA methyltransferase [Candidatus Midichloria mitochondrii]MDJ1298594.1 RNA methyltransferase [Candidatus Midichloria mitochondrii]MDJ1312744.1 RNA methyltransferase [Candidatus Midichloria mitochondrii]MDJ1583311.1 RNA methyltransferase [Candidatus Midichloria mitochondrii]